MKRVSPRLAGGPEFSGRAAVAEAVRLFNAGRYRQAVDAFEVPYHEAPAGERDGWLGLVRAAAALHHLEAGNRSSARRLSASAAGLLQAGGDRPAGVVLGDLPAYLARLAAALEGSGDGEAPAGPPPLAIAAEGD